jgi:hypothetical protein
VSDKELEAQIQTQLSGIITNQATLPNVIEFIFKYEKVVAADTSQETIQEALIIVEKFKKYLGVEPEDIYKDGSTIFVKFQLQGV